MTIIFYKNESQNNVVYKELSSQLTYDKCVLKDKTNVKTPTIDVDIKMNIVDYNYCYIQEFNRYYYISDIKSTNRNLWEIDLKVDVLMSFKEYFGNITAIVSRGQSLININSYIVDNENVVQNNSSVHTYLFPETPLHKELSYIITTVGGV